VSRLRKALDEESCGVSIETVRGIGYALREVSAWRFWTPERGRSCLDYLRQFVKGDAATLIILSTFVFSMTVSMGSGAVWQRPVATRTGIRPNACQPRSRINAEHDGAVSRSARQRRADRFFGVRTRFPW